MNKFLYFFVFCSTIIVLVFLYCSSDSDNSSYSPYVTSTETTSDYLYWDIQNIQMVSPSFGWAIGRIYNHGYYHPIYLKCDNGIWSEEITPSSSLNILIENFHLLSFTNGWACGKKLQSSGNSYQGVVYQLSALKWSEVDLPAVSANWLLNDLYFNDVDNGYAVGTIFDSSPSGYDNGLILQRTSGTWSTITPSLSPILSTEDWELRKIQMIDNTNGFAVGSIYGADGLQGLGIAISNSWKDVIFPIFSREYLCSDLSIVDTSFMYMVGESYNLNSSIDKKGFALFYNSISFSESSYPSISGNWNFVKCHFLTTTEGLFIGNNITSNGSITSGFVAKLENSNWSLFPSPTLADALTWEIKGLSVISQNDFYITGVEKYSQPITSSNGIPYIAKGIILRYYNGTWYKLSLPDISF